MTSETTENQQLPTYKGEPTTMTPWEAVYANMTDKNNPDNRLVYGQCPAWVVESAATQMCESYDRYGEPISQRTRNTGNRLYKHVKEGNDADLRAMIRRNVDKIEEFLPATYGGILKQEFNRSKKPKKW